MLNVSLTTFLVCPLIIGTSVEERAPERTFATPVRVTRPQSREAVVSKMGILAKSLAKVKQYPGLSEIIKKSQIMQKTTKTNFFS